MALDLATFLAAALLITMIRVPASTQREQTTARVTSMIESMSESMSESIRAGASCLRGHAIARPLVIMEAIEHVPHGVWTSALMLVAVERALNGQSSDGGSVNASYFLLQVTVTDEMMGRVYAIRNMFRNVVFMLAGLLFAWMADSIDVRMLYLLAGLLYFGTGLYALSSRALRLSKIEEENIGMAAVANLRGNKETSPARPRSISFTEMDLGRAGDVVSVALFPHFHIRSGNPSALRFE